MNNLTNALLITAIGMGLVFLSLIVLWGLMALTIRVFPHREEPEEAEEAAGEGEAVSEETPPEAVVAPARKRHAAAIAVALALQLASGASLRAQEASGHQPPAVSAWQSVMRSNMLNKRGPKR